LYSLLYRFLVKFVKEELADSKIKNTQLKNDIMVLAELPIKVSDILNKHWMEKQKEMQSILEEKFKDTITGLSDEINELVKIIIEERTKISAELSQTSTKKYRRE
jgi:hypothetical protein